MTQPSSFEQCDESGRVFVCSGNKAIYGLKQAPREWFEQFKHFLLTNLQFTVPLADCCLFIKKTNKENVLLLVYVDDIIIMGSDSVAIETTISHINTEFKLKDLGEGVLNYFLGMDDQVGEDCLLLGQKNHINELLLKVGLSKPSSLPTLMSSNFLGKIVLAQHSSPPADVSLYGSTIGSLQHVCITVSLDLISTLL